MGIPAFWPSPFLRAPSSHITLAIWVRVRARVISLRFWIWVCPKHGDAHITVTPPPYWKTRRPRGRGSSKFHMQHTQHAPLRKPYLLIKREIPRRLKSEHLGKNNKLNMAYCRLLLSLLFLMHLLSVTKSSVIPNNSAVRRPNSDSKCPVYNTYYNSHFNTGLTDKKVEALLHRVLKGLSEMRDEIRSSKGNKTAGKYSKYTALKPANYPKNSIPTI